MLSGGRRGRRALGIRVGDWQEFLRAGIARRRRWGRGIPVWTGWGRPIVRSLSTRGCSLPGLCARSRTAWRRTEVIVDQGHFAEQTGEKWNDHYLCTSNVFGKAGLGTFQSEIAISGQINGPPLYFLESRSLTKLSGTFFNYRTGGIERNQQI
jgi:hypothetical protein